LHQLRFSKKVVRQLVRTFLIIFCIVNLLGYISAYSLTHFKTPGQFGLGSLKPSSSKLPTDLGLKYQTKRIPVNPSEWLETWSIPVEQSTSKGTILLFHGDKSTKAKQLLPPAQVFHDLGYDTILVDFRGVGGSSGNTTTIGMREARDVAQSASYAQSSQLQRPLVLYGVSMGAAAILRAVAQENVNPDAIILELPFARLLDAVRSRIREKHIPTFPLAEAIVFWGGFQHGFNGFAHNPVDDARQVKCPTLLLHGKLDKWTTGTEIDRIYQNLQGIKQLSIFSNAGHELLVKNDRHRWKQEMETFLSTVTSQVPTLDRHPNVIVSADIDL
jgi:uncharacterized protein